MGLTLLTAPAAQFITILVLDFKGDFVDVPDRLGRDRWNHYSTADGFRVGCGPPFGCAQHLGSWINQLVKLLSAHCNFKFAEASLSAVIRIAFNLLNNPPTGSLVPPSLGLIAELLDTLPRPLIASKDEYLRTAQQKIGHLQRVSGGLFDAEEGFDITQHLIQPKRCAVIDCTTLSPLLGQILVNLLALQLMFPRLVNREVSEKTNFVLVVDEADQFCSRDASSLYPEGYNELGRLVKQGRQFGVMVALGMSFLEQCSRFISSNVTYHAIMNQSDAASVAEAARTLLQPSSQQLISSLKPGQALYKEAMGPVPHAMLMTADHVPASTTLRPEHFDHHPHTPARGIKDIPDLAEKIDALVREHRGVSLRQAPPKTNQQRLGKLARLFLDYASLPENIFAPVHVVFRHVGNVAPATQLAVMQELERAGFMAFAQVRIGKANLKLKEITEKGWAYLQKPAPTAGGKGGLAHRHYAHWIYDWAVRKGYQDCRLEPPVPGTRHFGDVGFEKDGRRHIAQVTAHCTSNIADHVRAALIESRAVDVLVFVTTVKSQHDAIRAKILADPDLVFCIDRIRFDVLDVYLKELWP
jgi:hypothetical protein